MDLMSKARAQMLLKHAFFGALVLSTKMVKDERVPTAYTDMVKIGYNPKFIESLATPDLVLFVLAHEVMHIVLKHGLRRGSRNPQRWNIAADFAINLMLRKSGFTVWEHALCDVKYDGMSSEQIYDEREKERDERIKNGQSKPQKGRGKPGEGTPDSGFEEDDGDGMGGDVGEPEAMDPASKAEIERSINQTVAQAASMARMQGKMPADLARLVDGILNPPLPWQQLLAEFATQVVNDDETWSRRNRRHSAVYLPSKRNERMGEIVIVGDTSGSMNGVFAQVAAEMGAIAEVVRPERIRVVWADDTACALEEVFEPGDNIDIHPTGGGGTDMRKPLEFIEKYDPVVAVLVTDGYTPWPASETPYPLIIVCTTAADCPDWARTIRMDVNG